MPTELKFAGICLLAMVVGCANDPVRVDKTNNSQMAVSLLFTHEGCNVYRFEDEGYLHYYAVCDKAAAATSSQIRHGSGKTRWSVPEENHRITSALSIP